MGNSATVLMGADSHFGGLTASSLIASIGTRSFADELLAAAHEICGAEHCSITQFREAELFGRASASIDHSDKSQTQLKLYIDSNYWQRDPGVIAMRRQNAKQPLSMIRVEIDGIEDTNAIWTSHDIAHRLLLWGGDPEHALGISFCRSGKAGDFTQGEIQDLQRWTVPMLNMLRKHAAISWTTPRFPEALTSLPNIEMCIRASGFKLPRREFEVGSRLIYGMSTTGIALELEIGEGSVMTYRKRLYERLNISCQRELLIWYVALWDQMFSSTLQVS